MNKLSVAIKALKAALLAIHSEYCSGSYDPKTLVQIDGSCGRDCQEVRRILLFLRKP